VLTAAGIVACGGDGAGPASQPNTPTPTPGAPVLTTLTMTLSAATIQVGQSATATVAGTDQNGAPIAVGTTTWSSSSSTVATVSATGIVLGVAPGQATISASVGSARAQQVVTVIAASVSSVAITPASLTVSVGESQTLTAKLLSATGATLTDRTVIWSSSDITKVTVTSAGVITGVAAGTATVTAASEGKIGTAAITVANPPAGTIVTAIQDPFAFIAKCPTSDTTFARIRQDFDFRYDGAPSTATVVCTDPYTTTPGAQMTNDMMNIQALRLAFYMNEGSRGKLPWTALGLYDWLKSQVAGINFHAQQGLSACCEVIAGRKYIITSVKDTTSLKAYRNWDGILGWLLLLAHEARHASGPGHTNGCPSFPLPTDPAGCDATYDLNNLGSYGVQQWLYAGVAIARINVGFGCTPSDSARKYAQSAATNANGYIGRFVTNAPATTTAATPFGGPCLR
jgi:hypothetical protein